MALHFQREDAKKAKALRCVVLSGTGGRTMLPFSDRQSLERFELVNPSMQVKS